MITSTWASLMAMTFATAQSRMSQMYLCMHEAYECLVDPMRRHQYDCLLNSGCMTEWAHPHSCVTNCCCHHRRPSYSMAGAGGCRQCAMRTTGQMGHMSHMSHMGGPPGGMGLGAPPGGMGGIPPPPPPPPPPHPPGPGPMAPMPGSGYSRPSSLMVEMSMDHGGPGSYYGGAGGAAGPPPRFPRVPYPHPAEGPGGGGGGVGGGPFDGFPPPPPPPLPPGAGPAGVGPGRYYGPFGPAGPPPPDPRFRGMGGPHGPAPPHPPPHADMPPMEMVAEHYGAGGSGAYGPPPPRGPPMMRPAGAPAHQRGMAPPAPHFSIHSKAI